MIPLISQKTWFDYFQILLAETRPKWSGSYPPEGNVTVKEDEVLVAIRNSKFGKAVGPEGILVELLKVLTKLINFILQGQELSKDL